MKTHINRALIIGALLITINTATAQTREYFEERAAREMVAAAVARTPEDREWSLRRMWANMLYLQLLFAPVTVPVIVPVPELQPDPRELRTGHRRAGCKPRR